MTKSALQVSEKLASIDEPILIVDKHGVLGVSLIHSLKSQFSDLPVVFVSNTEAEPLGDEWKNVLVVPYKKPAPVIPQAKYSYILLVYDGEKETTDYIKEFLSEAESVKAKLIFICPIAYFNTQIVNTILDSYKHSHVVFLGEIFDVTPVLFEKPTLSDLLENAKTTKQITLSHMGLQTVFPICLDDAVSGILQVVFGTSIVKKVFYLFPKHPPTILSLSRLMQKIEPDIRLDFINEEEKKEEIDIQKILSYDGVYVVEDHSKLEEKIKHVLQENQQKPQKLLRDFPSTKVNSQINIKQTKSNNSKKTFSGALFFIFFWMFLLLLPVISTFGFLYGAGLKTQALMQALEKGESAKLESLLAQSHTLFKLSRKSASVLLFEAKVLGKENNIKQVLEAAKTGEKITALGQKLLISSKNILTTKKFPLLEIKAGLVMAQQLQTEDDKRFLPSFLKDQTIISALKRLSSMIDIMPTLLGSEKERAYLVLFQNNMELRPGGGFIGSYGLLKVKDNVLDLSIHDVYSADGKLKGHVEPPFAFRRYFPLVHWYLRDSNFSPDFPKNASTSAFFLRQETGEVVDGVIAVDVFFIKEILKIVGPIKVSDYNEIVTADNVYMLMQTHAEKNFFPGSSQKKDFLNAVFMSLQQQLFLHKEKNVPYLRFASVIEKAILEKHILVAFSNTTLQMPFTVHGMSSSLQDVREKGEGRINDFFGISEANIGANKANFFVTRTIDQKVVLGEKGSITETVTLTYANTSKLNQWPGGDYKNYLRIFVPFGSELSSVVIDGKKQTFIDVVTDPKIYEAKNFKPPPGLEVEKTNEEGKTSFGFLTVIPASSKKIIEITYVLPENLALKKPTFTYSQYFFKQPGTGHDPFSFALSYPKTYHSLGMSNGLKDVSGNILIQGDLSSDRQFLVQFLAN